MSNTHEINLNEMITESRNDLTLSIDEVSTLEMLEIINGEDKKVALAVEKVIPEIAKAVDKIVEAFKIGGRLIYAGAGTSGRLGILDASECPPTFGTKPEQVVGLIAGGHTAIFKAVENAEDNLELGKSDLEALNFNKNDVLVGIAASGRTPYVQGAVQYAKSLGATTVFLGCNPAGILASMVDISIAPVVGAEVITGSSRLKAGTAQKLVLNMLTTGSMIRSGKVYGNLMVDVEATNKKLVIRQQKIVIDATGCSEEEAIAALIQSNRHCKTAIVMILSGVNAQEAKQLLKKHNGFVRQALNEVLNQI
ncbi:N-acetylmuramic acid 6-phosphate etherase [Thorsellia kenyensis]|uniref:N-acetylmuramic acid 6-phosphate etherase n=1 Tax=Thorsellia kenyensis TaxID=1549888 RepID=A0ABV6CA55_9GAMM